MEYPDMSELNVQPQGGMPNYGMPPAMSSSDLAAESGSFMKWQISPSDILIELMWKLRGFVYNEANEKWEQVFERQMSEKGISETVALLSIVINKNTVLSNLDEERIVNYTMTFGKALTNLFKNNWEEYGIPRTKLTALTISLVKLVYTTLQRAKDGAFLKHLETVERVNTIMREGYKNSSQDFDHEKKGFSLRRLFSMGK